MYSLKEMFGAVFLVWTVAALFNLAGSLVLTFLISIVSKIFFGFTFEPMHKTIIFALLIIFNNASVKMNGD